MAGEVDAVIQRFLDGPRALFVDDARAQALARPSQQEAERTSAVGPLGEELAAGISEKCYAAGPTAGPKFQSALGVLAHAIIATDYELALSVMRGRDLFVDDSFIGPVNRDYVAFLFRKNPGLSPDVQNQIRRGNYKRPDIVLDDGPRREFEEIKSDSEAGRNEGRKQVRVLSLWMQGLGLPYTTGSSYDAPSRIPIFDTTVAGLPVDFSIRTYRDQPGLILYRYCIRADWTRLTKNGVIAIVIIIIAFLLKYGGVIPKPPGSPPILPIPIPQPNPIPIPIPVPLNVRVNQQILDSMAEWLPQELRQTLGVNAEKDIPRF
jgi:hypothetical protein